MVEVIFLDLLIHVLFANLFHINGIKECMTMTYIIHFQGNLLAFHLFLLEVEVGMIIFLFGLASQL